MRTIYEMYDDGWHVVITFDNKEDAWAEYYTMIAEGRTVKIIDTDTGTRIV